MTDLDPITAAELLDQLAGRLADLAASTSGPRVTLRPPEAAAALGALLHLLLLARALLLGWLGQNRGQALAGTERA